MLIFCQIDLRLFHDVNYNYFRTRVYRDGEEIQPLLDDGNYDFNFQETRKLKEERQLRPVGNIKEHLHRICVCVTQLSF